MIDHDLTNGQIETLPRESRHPMQPIVNADGVARFKANKIVQFILTNSQFIDDDTLAAMNFTDEDREQFAQLLGYHVGGYVELPYVSERSSHEAQLAENKLNPSSPYVHELSWVDETSVSCDPTSAPKRSITSRLNKMIVDFLAEMRHEGCTPRGGCPIAAFKRDYNAAKSHAESLGLMPAHQFEAQAKSRAAQEPRKFKIGKKGLAILAEKFERELTPEEIDGLERGAEEELANT